METLYALAISLKRLDVVLCIPVLPEHEGKRTESRPRPIYKDYLQVFANVLWDRQTNFSRRVPFADEGVSLWRPVGDSFLCDFRPRPAPPRFFSERNNRVGP